MLLGLLASCGADETQGGGPDLVSEGCVSNEQFFLKEVWTPVLEKSCYNCHNPQGQARETNMVFQPPGQVGFLEANLEIFTEMASYQRSGRPLILAKPAGDFDHGGGAVLQEDDGDLAALNTMLARVANPVSCRDDVQEDFFDKLVYLSPEQTLRKATLSLVGRLPTDGEVLLVEEGGIEALEPILDRIMLEAPFLDRVEEIWGDLLLTDRYLGGDNAVDLLNTEFYPDARWYMEEGADQGEDPAFMAAARTHSNNSLAREGLKHISFLVANELPFTEVISAEYKVVNPFTARIYGVDVAFDDPLDETQWKKVDLVGAPQAGVLTSPMFLNRFPTTDTNRNRHRSKIVYDYFVATDVLTLAERPIDPTSTSHNPTLNDPQCSVCHAVVDPVAGAFQNWDAQGNYNPPEAWYAEMRPPGYGKQSVPAEDNRESLSWLAQRITEDSSFDVSIVHIMFEALTGQEPMGLPRTENSVNYDLELEAYNNQQDFLNNMARGFRANGHNLKLMVKSIVRSPWFRAKGASQDLSEEDQLLLANVGMGRMLTPEMLNRKLQAVLGLPWRPRIDRADYLLNRDEYKILYGGIDSLDVTQRITDPNGIMAAIQFRMANEMACLVTARDFSNDLTDRRFFSEVETSYVPEDEHGFAIQMSVTAIKRNIQRLHWHLLGERVELGDDELEATYDLFYETWKEGQEGLRSEELSVQLAGACRVTTDYFTGRDLPEERRIVNDPDYTLRAWMAVMTYLLSDHNFLYE